MQTNKEYALAEMNTEPPGCKGCTRPLREFNFAYYKSFLVHLATCIKGPKCVKLISAFFKNYLNEAADEVLAVIENVAAELRSRVDRIIDAIELAMQRVRLQEDLEAGVLRGAAACGATEREGVSSSANHQKCGAVGLRDPGRASLEEMQEVFHREASEDMGEPRRSDVCGQIGEKKMDEKKGEGVEEGEEGEECKDEKTNGDVEKEKEGDTDAQNADKFVPQAEVNEYILLATIPGTLFEEVPQMVFKFVFFAISPFDKISPIIIFGTIVSGVVLVVSIIQWCFLGRTHSNPPLRRSPEQPTRSNTEKPEGIGGEVEDAGVQLAQEKEGEEPATRHDLACRAEAAGVNLQVADGREGNGRAEKKSAKRTPLDPLRGRGLEVEERGRSEETTGLVVTHKIVPGDTAGQLTMRKVDENKEKGKGGELFDRLDAAVEEEFKSRRKEEGHSGKKEQDRRVQSK
uniref:Uncharacterized protein n=1 Tax=Chromera velia CCMP2878 TaxID=1169474 RepID=A0A0G4I4D7_9ALVE|eukprot:Cvel_10894.t1-p1 / transcript=Cvel_10894.t1 / gene=Cvel_10894 / organism=Chromera_velia_CCMP2878 / gene_product=hypothetical protein / transcript_product=hypothetical protein / location=Cvel_scaffold668:66131-67667(-) / protein_length=459 / sequence_SO=supercontig / SO=protein_coding / is_pseudo=false